MLWQACRADRRNRSKTHNLTRLLDLSDAISTKKEVKEPMGYSFTSEYFDSSLNLILKPRAVLA